MTSPESNILRKLAHMRHNGNFRLSMEQMRRLDHIKQGQFTAAIVEDEEVAVAPRFISDIQDIEIFVDEGEPAVFECRVEPKHDLNLSVRWYRDDEELVSGGRMKISHDYGHVSLNIFFTYPEDEGLYTCRATNEQGEDETCARLICRPLPHLKFNTPAFLPDEDEADVQLALIQESAKRHGIRAKLRGDENFTEGTQQAPKFLLKMENFPKVMAGQTVSLQTFVVPVGDPSMKVEWFLNGEPLLFKSIYSPVYDHGFLGLTISKVYPDDFGEFCVRVTNRAGSADLPCWVGELGEGEPYMVEEEPDLPAWCNKVEKGRLAIDCPPEITKHLVDMEVGETDTAKLEVNFIGNPRPEVVWTREGKELANSRHVQVREREGKTTLILINITPDMGGEYRMVVVSPLGSDMTICRLSVIPLDQESLDRMNRMEAEGLRQLVNYEEEKLLEKKRRKWEKEERLRETKEKAKRNA